MPNDTWSSSSSNRCVPIISHWSAREHRFKPDDNQNSTTVLTSIVNTYEVQGLSIQSWDLQRAFSELVDRHPSYQGRRIIIYKIESNLHLSNYGHNPLQ